MVVFKPLKAKERNEVLAGLTPLQTKVYWNSVAYRVSDRLLTKIYHGSAGWRFYAMNIDYEWDWRRSGQCRTRPLKCMCGRPLRYQYELESVENPKRHVLLGSTHFAEHLGIPLSVAQEIRGNLNQVQSLMDEILIKVRMHQGFPKRFAQAIQKGKMAGTRGRFADRIHAFMEADLPLPAVWEHKLSAILEGEVAPHHRPRTRGEILQQVRRQEDQERRERQKKSEQAERELAEQVAAYRRLSKEAQFQIIEERIAKTSRGTRSAETQVEKPLKRAKKKAEKRVQTMPKHDEVSKGKDGGSKASKRSLVSAKAIPLREPIPFNSQLHEQLKKWREQN